MKMMPIVKPIMMLTTRKNWKAVEFAHMIPSWLGSWETMLTKMMSDIPLPMPRWVMSSPSHMMSAVPAVIVMTMMSTRRGVYSGMRSRPPVKLPLWKRNVNPVDWRRARATVR